MRKFLQSFLAVFISFSSSLFAKAQHLVFQRGDIFLGQGGGTIQWRDSNGVFLRNIITGDGGGNGNGTGLRINPVTGKLWVANSNLTPNSPNGVRIINTDGTPGNAINVSAYQGNPTSITFDKQGNGYIGDLWAKTIVKINPAGTTVLDHYSVSTDGYTYGPEWVEMDCNDSIIYYTYLNKRIKRYNVVTRQQLPDFANLTSIPYWLFAMRLLPDNGMIVAAADKHNFRLNAAGSIIQTYDTTTRLQSYFGIAATPDGKSFWAGGLAFYAPMYKFDIATGHVIDSFLATANQGGNIHGIAIYGDKLNNCPENIVIYPTPATTNKIFPNPCNGNFTLETDLTGNVQLVIYDQLGKLVCTKNFNSGVTPAPISIHTGILSPGVYLLKLFNTDKSSFQKLVIQ